MYQINLSYCIYRPRSTSRSRYCFSRVHFVFRLSLICSASLGALTIQKGFEGACSSSLFLLYTYANVESRTTTLYDDGATYITMVRSLPSACASASRQQERQRNPAAFQVQLAGSRSLQFSDNPETSEQSFSSPTPANPRI